MRLVYILIPLWILDGLSFLAAFGIMIREREKWIMPAWCCVVLPMVIFEILLSAHDDGANLSWPVVFIPFYVWAAGWLGMGCMLSGMLIKDRYHIDLNPFNR